MPAPTARLSQSPPPLGQQGVAPHDHDVAQAGHVFLVDPFKILAVPALVLPVVKRNHDPGLEILEQPYLGSQFDCLGHLVVLAVVLPGHALAAIIQIALVDIVVLEAARHLSLGKNHAVGHVHQPAAFDRLDVRSGLDLRGGILPLAHDRSGHGGLPAPEHQGKGQQQHPESFHSTPPDFPPPPCPSLAHLPTRYENENHLHNQSGLVLSAKSRTGQAIQRIIAKKSRSGIGAAFCFLVQTFPRSISENPYSGGNRCSESARTGWFPSDLPCTRSDSSGTRRSPCPGSGPRHRC